MNRLILFLLFVLIIIFSACETRLPVDDIEFDEKLSLNLYVDGDPEVEAFLDTLILKAQLLDNNNNVVSLSGRDSLIDVNAVYGTISEKKDKYYFSKIIDSTLQDTIIMALSYNGGLDIVSDTLLVTIKPSESSIGFLPPDKINISIRTDTVYMMGGWNMFIDGIVSDSLGNPVKNGISVFFTIDSSTVDTSLVVLENISYTGDSAKIGNIKDQIPGNALNVLNYNSKAIGATIIVKAQIQDDTTIIDFDTLKLPVPKHNLKLIISDRNGGIVDVPKDSYAIAKFEVSLQDGFNKAIPYHYVNVASLAGRIIPNAKVYNDDSTMVIGSTPAIVDSLEYDTLDNPYSGYTDSNGTFDLYIKMSSNEAPVDDKVKTMAVQVEVEEATTHHKETEFSFQVLFNK